MDPIILAIIIVLSSLLFIYIALWLFGLFIIQKFFKRLDLENAPELFNYDDVKDKYDRKEFSFKSLGKKLSGYIYGYNNSKTIVYVHGMCPGHCGYLSDIMALVDKGYKVITYDYTATGSSEGKFFYGLAQQKYDLNSLFRYLKNTEYNNSELYLYGHSMGGYAVGCACGKYKNVKKIVSISGFDNPYRFLISAVSKDDSLIKRITFTPIRIAFFMHFGIHSNEVASKTISKSNSNILIIHGSEDEIVNIKYSIYNKKNQIKNKNAEYLLMEEEYHNRHNTVIASTECVKYQMELEAIFNEELAKTNDRSKARKKMLEGIDKYKFNHANGDLMNIIDEYYKK